MWTMTGARSFLESLQDVVPEADEVVDVGLEVGLGAALALGAHDDAEAVGLDSLADPLEPVALGAVLDLAGDADVARLGHEDDAAARQGDAGGDAGALGAARPLGDLHHDLLAGAQAGP